MSEDKKKCPDGGACHHLCEAACFRVQYCAPLSNVYYKDKWPQQVVYENERADYSFSLTRVQVMSLLSHMRRRGWSKSAKKLESQLFENNKAKK